MGLAILCALLFGLARAGAPAADPPKPNIIVFYTDDHGHADLGCQGVVTDIRTPHVDALAANGVRMAHGYSTAPQCVPSRGGLMTGRFQCRFGLENNGSSLEGFDRETTIARRLQGAGYITAQFGKWHLGPTPAIPKHGFTHVFAQNAQHSFSANITLDGQDRPMGDLPPEMYHIDGCSRAAASLIERYREQPFFLYVAYRAPHVPLDAPRQYLDRFPGPMPERRRQALAMISAVDDGVGLIMHALREHGLEKKTLVFLIGDNGAPLKIHKADEPGGGAGWDGSLNDPLNGEKGMLAEGGMHVPFVVSWPGTIPAGQAYRHPVTALDVAATAASLAGVAVRPGDLDGVNLMPHLTGENKAPPHDALFWRWGAQCAIRESKWKLLRGGDREYLYDLDADLGEKHNLASKHPDIAERLRERLRAWTMELNPPGLAVGGMAETWNGYFDHYLEGKPAGPLREKFRAKEADEAAPGSSGDATATADFQGWQARNGTLSVKDGALQVTAEKGTKAKAPFLTRGQIALAAPATVSVQFKADAAGPMSLAWRLEGDRDFRPDNSSRIDVTASDGWQARDLTIPAEGTVVHLRVHLPGDTPLVRRIDVRPANGEPVSLWK